MRFLQNTRVRIISLVISDILLISLSVILAFLLRFEGSIPGQYFQGAIQGMIFFSILFLLPLFYFFKLYFFSWSYISTTELISLVKAMALGFLLISSTLFLFRDHPALSGFPRSTLFISYFLIIIFCGGTRFVKRIYLEVLREKKGVEKTRTLIVGAGDAGELVLRSVLADKRNTYYPVGFVDDNKNKMGVMIHGLRVLGKIDDIPDLVRINKIEEIIIALPSAGSAPIRNAVELGRKAGIKKIKIIPTVSDIIDGEAPIMNIREVEVEDLLGRDPVKIDVGNIEKLIKDRVILVTGGAGSIGSELCRQIIIRHPSLLLILDQDETAIFNITQEIKRNNSKNNVLPIIGDVTDKNKIDQIFEEYKPNVVFHAAAYKHVPLMEEHPDEAVKNNIIGTEIVAQAANNFGTERFVFISTDKAVNPTSVMGATKRIGEMVCNLLNKEKKTKFMSVRFGNVLNSRGSVIPTFKDQIKKRRPVEVTHPEMKRYFMMISEAVLLVMQAGSMGDGGEVFVLDMGKPIKIIDLAKDMIRLSGFEPDKDIPIVFTGIRPGEKLFEEIMSADEGISVSGHEKIFVANLSSINEKELSDRLNSLKDSSFRGDRFSVLKTLRDIIPTYKNEQKKEQ